MFDYRLLNLDGTPAEHPTFRSSQPDWQVGDKVLIRPAPSTGSSGWRQHRPKACTASGSWNLSRRDI